MSKFNDVIKQAEHERLAKQDYEEQVEKKPTPLKRYFLKSDPSIYFTEREFDCIRGLSKRQSAPDIAEDNGLAVRTIEYFIRSIRLKLEKKSKTELEDYFQNYTELFV